MRLVLAATLSPSYGIYSGYELCENQAVPGTEDYLNSEKYEIRTRDWHAPGNISEFIARLNAIRRGNPAPRPVHQPAVPGDRQRPDPVLCQGHARRQRMLFWWR